MNRTAPDRRFADRLGIALPLVQAPMAGSQDERLAVAVANAGGVGSLPCAMLSPEAIGIQVQRFRALASGPVNLNFFCHEPAALDEVRERAWRERLRGYYQELGLDPDATHAAPARAPFDDALCAIVEQVRPEMVSFHFGVPSPSLFARVRATGACIVSTATTVAEARHLEAAGCDAIIAQGTEAGGHRGMFLTTDVGTQAGTFALVPQIVDAVGVPVIAAGGIADARGVAAALALGAGAVQVGTAFLRTPEATTSAVHRAALTTAHDDDTRLTTIFSGRPARGLENRLMRELGALPDGVPAFPRAAAALAALRAKAEATGSSDFSPLWAGQAVTLAREVGAAEVVRALFPR